MSYTTPSNYKGLRDRANRIKELVSGWVDRARQAVSNITERVTGLWTRAHEGVYAVGQVNNRETVWLRWDLGKTELHCKDCANLNGQIHTAEEWRAAGIQPQSFQLECEGWRCDCRLTPLPGYTGEGEGNIGYWE